VSFVYKKYITHSSAVNTTYVIESVWSDSSNNNKKNDIETATLFKSTLYEYLNYSYYNIVYSIRAQMCGRCGFAGIDCRVAQQQRI